MASICVTKQHQPHTTDNLKRSPELFGEIDLVFVVRLRSEKDGTR